MSNQLVLTVDVEEPYLGAIKAAAAARQIDSIDIVGELSEHSSSTELALAVIEADGDGHDAIERVRAVRKVFHQAPAVVLAHRISPETAFRLSGLGVAGFVELPASEREVASRCLDHLISARSDQLPQLVGDSPAMNELQRRVALAATSSATILLTGETGTGKGLIARAIHQVSSRRDRPFVHTDCSALSPSLIESELFGHERGSFTGAVASRAGRFERAGDGTIFLDEIGELELPLQSKFLRVIEDREYERVGGTSLKHMDARVIAATNRNLARDLSEGRFRPDLYYRLKVVHVHVPPLRERIGDIPLLVEPSLERLAGVLELPKPCVTPAFYDRLMLHSWPGNVRELINVLEAAMVQTRSSRLDAHHLDGLLQSGTPTWSTPGEPVAPGSAALASAEESAGDPQDERRERAEMLQLLVATGGNVARVARRLKMARSTVRYKIRSFGLVDYIPKD